MLMDKMDIFTCAPHNDLLSDRKPNEAYCMANPGKEYAVYFPKGGEITLDISALPTAALRWLDIPACKWGEPETFKGGQKAVLRPPGEGSWVALLKAEDVLQYRKR